MRNSKSAFAVSALALIFCAAASAGPHKPKVGATLADFELTRQGGAKTRFSALGKKVVLVNFWASWCAPCLKEMPGIIELWKSYHEKGFEVVAVNEDEDALEGINKTRKRFDFPFDLYVDTEEKLAKSFGAASYPFTLVLNAKGKVLAFETQERDWNSAKSRKQLEGWLK